MRRISTALIIRRSFWDRDTLAALKREIKTQTRPAWAPGMFAAAKGGER
jgi:hypothetical protein